MYYSNNYRLECQSISSAKNFELVHNISLVLKILSLLSLIAIIWRLWIVAVSIFLYIISIIVSKKAFSMVFTFEYWLDNEVLKITKHYKNNAVKQLIALPLKSTFLCEIVSYSDIDFSSKSCYIDKNFESELYLQITTSTQKFYMIADKYLYSLLMEKK